MWSDPSGRLPMLFVLLVVVAGVVWAATPPGVSERRWQRSTPRSGRARKAAIGAALTTLVAALTLVPAPRSALAAGEPPPVVLELFWLDGCPHCAAEWEFLRELGAEHPRLTIEDHELHDATNQRLLKEAGARLGFKPGAVPTTIIDSRVWIGFSDEVADEIRDAVTQAEGGSSPAGTVAPATPPLHVVDVPLVGDVNVDNTPLLVATLLIGFVDGVNPCSLWVLSILLGLVLHTGSRRRVVAVGSVFLVVTTAMYGLYMVGVYSLLAYAAYLTWIQRGVAVLAAGVGIVNIKDYFWYRQGLSLTIADKHHPALYRRARAVAQSSRALPAVLATTALMAVGVSLLETPCTAGFPVIWTDMLAANDVGFAAAAALFAAYMAVFLLDEFIIFGTVVVTMRAAKVQERHARTLKLVGGTVMLTLAVVMVIEPDLLNTLTGTAAVFGMAAAVVAAVLLATRLVGQAQHPQVVSAVAGHPAPAARSTRATPASRPHRVSRARRRRQL